MVMAEMNLILGFSLTFVCGQLVPRPTLGHFLSEDKVQNLQRQLLHLSDAKVFHYSSSSSTFDRAQ